MIDIDWSAMPKFEWRGRLYVSGAISLGRNSRGVMLHHLGREFVWRYEENPGSWHIKDHALVEEATEASLNVLWTYCRELDAAIARELGRVPSWVESAVRDRRREYSAKAEAPRDKEKKKSFDLHSVFIGPDVMFGDRNTHAELQASLARIERDPEDISL